MVDKPEFSKIFALVQLVHLEKDTFLPILQTLSFNHLFFISVDTLEYYKSARLHKVHSIGSVALQFFMKALERLITSAYLVHNLFA